MRQYFKLGQKMSPAARKIYTEEKYTLCCKYNREKLAFAFFQSTFELFQSIFTLFFIRKIFSWFNQKVTKRDELFALSFILANQFFDIPFFLYYDFILEKKYGFNRKTLKVFFKDFFITLLLHNAIFTPLLFIIKFIVNTFPNFPLYLTLFMTAFRVFMIIIFPNFITPLYHKVTPLENIELKEKVEKLAEKVGFTINKIEVIDGSTRSSHSNAYFIGIFKAKRIVFYDTLLKQMTDDEILAVLCHELGHWHHNHVLLNTIIASIQTLIYSFFLKIFLGVKGDFKYGPNMVFYTIAMSVLALPSLLLFNSISRKFERQADAFAVKHKYGNHLISGLLKLATENMGSPVVDSLYSTISHSHPHITERIECIENEMKKQE